MPENVIRASQNGPFLVTGPATLIDEEGNETEIERKTVALCRCGGSQNKPFCDGTHSEIGFKAAEAAVRQAQGGE
jgi:CDGSH-type Zn-finger protein